MLKLLIARKGVGSGKGGLRRCGEWAAVAGGFFQPDGYGAAAQEPNFGRWIGLLHAAV